MKNTKRTIAALALAGILETAAHPFGGVVLDPTNLIQNIISASNSMSQLVQIIEQVKKAQATYEQLQKSVQKLASADQFVLQELQQLLGNELGAYKEMENYFTQDVLSYNGTKFSFADLFAERTVNGKTQSGMDSLTAMINGMVSGDMENSISSLMSNITAEQKNTIMKQYGMTPESYIRYKATKNEQDKLIEEIFSRLTAPGWNDMRNQNLEKTKNLLENVQNAEGEMQVLQNLAELQGQIVMSINQLNENTMRLGANSALETQLAVQKAETERYLEAFERNKALNSGVMPDSNF